MSLNISLGNIRNLFCPFTCCFARVGTREQNTQDIKDLANENQSNHVSYESTTYTEFYNLINKINAIEANSLPFTLSIKGKPLNSSTVVCLKDQLKDKSFFFRAGSHEDCLILSLYKNGIFETSRLLLFKNASSHQIYVKCEGPVSPSSNQTFFSLFSENLKDFPGFDVERAEEHNLYTIQEFCIAYEKASHLEPIDFSKIDETKFIQNLEELEKTSTSTTESLKKEITNHPGYFDRVDSKTAEKMLTRYKNPNRTFLIRNNDKQPNVSSRKSF